MSRTFLLIDGYNFFIKHYLANPTMDVNGEPVGGVVGFLKGLKFLVDQYKPTAAVVVWDGEGGSERRRSIRSEYKAGRKVRLNREYDFDTTAGDDRRNMERQRSLLDEYLTILGVPQTNAAGVEADDVLAYLCAHVLQEDATKIVVSNDRDLLQLVDEHVKVYSHSKKRLLDVSAVIDDVGCLPKNYAAVKAVCGDRGDNVKGVKGVGPKTLVKLCPALRDTVMGLDEVLTHVESVAAKGKSKHASDVVALGRGTIAENMALVDLSSPVMSAAAARHARESFYARMGFNAAGIRFRAAKDGLQISENLDNTFRQLTVRRSLWLSSLKEKDVV